MRRTTFILLSSFSLVLLAACGDDATSTGSGGAGGGAGGQGGGATQGGAGQGGGAVLCGGELGGTCGPTEFCDFENDQCGGNDASGVCTPRPDGCTDEVDPTCGCDGQIHSNACEARAAGADVSLLGGCTPPANTYACGASFCNVGDVCTQTTNDTPGPYAYYSCTPPPAACTGVATTCDCAGDLALGCGGSCSDVTGGVLISCPGG